MLVKEIEHSGIKGMKWYEHKFGRWQKQAQYANGLDDPEAVKKEYSEVLKFVKKASDSEKRKNFYSKYSDDDLRKIKQIADEKQDIYRKYPIEKQFQDLLRDLEEVDDAIAAGVYTKKEAEKMQEKLSELREKRKDYSSDLDNYRRSDEYRDAYYISSRIGYELSARYREKESQKYSDNSLSEIFYMHRKAIRDFNDKYGQYGSLIRAHYGYGDLNDKSRIWYGMEKQAINFYNNNKSKIDKELENIDGLTEALLRKQYPKSYLNHQDYELFFEQFSKVPITSLEHSGIKGMKWYQHKFGRWQKHAEYAGGRDDPDAKKSDKKREKNLSSPRKLKRHYKEYSEEEIKEAIKNFDTERKLSKYTADDIKMGADILKNLAGMTESAIKSYNSVAAIRNAFSKSENKWPTVNTGKKDSEKKKKKKDEDDDDD